MLAWICRRTFEKPRQNAPSWACHPSAVWSTILSKTPDPEVPCVERNMNQLQFQRWLVIGNGAVPLFMLAWDAWNKRLGANAVNEALHITGILSLSFLFLSLLMTPLRWYSNWTGWIAFRRALGLYGFWYAVVHLAIFFVFDRALDLASTLHEVWTRRYLQVGFVALLLMLPLAVTSTNYMVRKLGAKRWKQLHRAAYVVPVLGVIHYYLLVKSDVRQPLAFAGVLALLLAGRLAIRNHLSRRVKSSPDKSVSLG